MQISKCNSELLKTAQTADQLAQPIPPSPAVPPVPTADPMLAAQQPQPAIPPLDTERIAKAFADAAKGLRMPMVDVRPMSFVDNGWFVFCEGRRDPTTNRPIAEIIFKVTPSGTSADIHRGLEIEAQRVEREIVAKACRDAGMAAIPVGKQNYNFVLAGDPDHFAPMAAAEQQKQQGMAGQAAPTMPGQVR